VLAIGLVVDDAIVVVEAVEHHIEQACRRRTRPQGHGEVRARHRHRARALGGVHPVAFMGGIQGGLNKQFAITIAVSV
jgi:multidrug efflux pump subunit AcrB